MESLNALFEFSTEGIIICNANGKIIRANPRSERMFGYEQGELLGKTVEHLIPSRFKEKHIGHRGHYVKEPHSRSMGKGIDLFGAKKDGTEFPVEISLTHYSINNERFVIAFIIDITERKSIEDRVRKINLELEKKVAERTKVLQEALRELEFSKQQLTEALANEKELNEMKSRFVTMASHEFRTPLSTILSSVSLIGKYTQTEDEEKRAKHVNRIKSAVANMTLILNDFLSAGRLEEGKVLPNLTNFSLEILTKEVIHEMQNLLKAGQKILYTHRGETELYSDSQMVKNILINLISNAIKFSPENKTITVTTESNENNFTISVKDQGIGIPPDEQQHLFERFFRAQNVTNIQGTGLGLSIVGKYIELLNGNIDFTSELNEGTNFIITIPNALLNQNAHENHSNN